MPQGIYTPGVAEVPRWDKNPGMTTAGEGVLGEGGRGRGGDKTPPTTQATEARGASGGAKERIGGPRVAPPSHPQRGTATYTNSVGTSLRHTAGTDGARPEHGALACHKYGLLVPTGRRLIQPPWGTRGEGAVIRPQEGRLTRPGWRRRRGKNPAVRAPSLLHARSQG